MLATSRTCCRRRGHGFSSERLRDMSSRLSTFARSRAMPRSTTSGRPPAVALCIVSTPVASIASTPRRRRTPFLIARSAAQSQSSWPRFRENGDRWSAGIWRDTASARSPRFSAANASESTTTCIAVSPSSGEIWPAMGSRQDAIERTTPRVAARVEAVVSSRLQIHAARDRPTRRMAGPAARILLRASLPLRPPLPR